MLNRFKKSFLIFSILYAGCIMAKPASLINGLTEPYPAPTIEGISEWINSKPLTLEELKGKVVLIDFWTYSCINCLRTLPYLNDWYQKYHTKGFEIIGIHSPEFDFEKEDSNVKSAVIKEGIQYPVALDNQFATWENYSNQFWPAHYLIDKDGKVVYSHFGEGEYGIMENNIRFLLGLNDKKMLDEEKIGNANLTPEIYLGYARNENFAGPEKITPNQVSNYTFPLSLPKHSWALLGSWKVSSQKIISQKAFSALKIYFQAKDVYLVMGSATGFPVKVKLLFDGKEVNSEKGSDVENGEILVKENRLYRVLSFPEMTKGILQVIASGTGLEIYTITFG